MLSTQALNRPDSSGRSIGLELPGIRFIDIGHTVATPLLSRGVHPKVVSGTPGHATIMLTLDTYSHLPTMRDKAGAIMDNILIACFVRFLKFGVGAFLPHFRGTREREKRLDVRQKSCGADGGIRTRTSCLSGV